MNIIRKTVSGICSQFTAELEKVLEQQNTLAEKKTEKRAKIADTAVAKIGVLEAKIYKVEDVAMVKVTAIDEEVTGILAEAKDAETAIGNVKKLFGQ